MLRISLRKHSYRKHPDSESIIQIDAGPIKSGPVFMKRCSAIKHLHVCGTNQNLNDIDDTEEETSPHAWS